METSEEVRGVAHVSPLAAPQEGSVVVCREIGNPLTAEGKRVSREFAEVVDKPLPLQLVPDLATIRRLLTAEFPHAERLADTLLSELSAFSYVQFRPTLLVGAPGCGKTTFACRLFDSLGIRSVTFSCGGVSDSALAGTPRRWSTGEPSLPTALMLRWQCSSPGIILDELEKVGTSRKNGNLSDALLGLLEPQSASAWNDPYLEAPIDLSHVLWLATANDLDGVPTPLRDRCRILRFPEPAATHLGALASRLLTKAVIARGLDPRWGSALTGAEIEALRKYWKGGSLRKLARLVEVVISYRESKMPIH